MLRVLANLETKQARQRLEIQEMDLVREEDLLKVRIKELELQRRAERNRKEAQELGLLNKLDLPTGEADPTALTADWVKDPSAKKRGGGAKAVPGPEKATSRASSKAFSSASQQQIAMLNERIKQLELLSARAAPVAEAGIDRLRALGIYPPSPAEGVSVPKPPTQQELKKLRPQLPEGKLDNTDIGKGDLFCCEHSQNSKLKSGKFLKTNVNIKYQENWPHVNVLKKYCKRCTFDNLDFDAFVAGETRVILQMADSREAEGRLKFLSMVAHWVCASKDWVTVRNLYEGVVESIELGQDTWLSDFSHYESMLIRAAGAKPDHKGVEPDKKGTQVKKAERPDVFWCKAYQKGTCQEKEPHMMTLKPDEPQVPVIHVCAYCLQKENTRQMHPESECPSKK